MKDFPIRSLLPTTFSRYNIPKAKLHYPWMEVYGAFVASVSFFCTGVVQSYTSPAIYSLESDGESNMTLSRSDISWIASSPSLAAFLGTMASAPLLEFWGRQKSLVVLTLPCLAGWFLIGFSTNLAMVHAGRAFTGLSIGIAKAAAPIYVSEISRASSRGVLGFLPPMMNALGILIGLLVGCWIEWRKLALVMSVFPVLLLLLSVWLPESPLWLLMKQQGESAFKSLQRLRGQGHDIRVQDELDEIRTSIEEMNLSASKLSWKDLIWRKENYMGFSLMIFQQFSGVSAVVYYLAMILSETSTSGNGAGGKLSHSVKPETAALSVGIVHFVAFFISLPLIDRLGRRVLLIVSGVLMALSHSTLALFLYFHLDPNGDFIQITASWLPLTALCGFIAAYSIGFGPVPFVFMTEVFSLKYRSYLCSMATMINQIASFCVLQLFPTLLTAMNPHYVFLVHAFVCISSVFFVFFIIPETKGKTLAEIEKSFREPNTLFEEKFEHGEHKSFQKMDMPVVYIPITSPITSNNKLGLTQPTLGMMVTSIYTKSPATLTLKKSSGGLTLQM